MLKINNLSKNYGNLKVLDNININIEPGIFGLLGPNGAGKTTMMKCIVSLINDYEGEISINGVKLNSSTVKKINVGYLPQHFSLYKHLKITEALEHIAYLKKVKNHKEQIDEILKQVNLFDERNKKIKNLSGGMLRRLGIAQALLGNPQILVIDEPTAGLDPKERVRFRNILLKLPKDIVVIISTHIVEDLNLIADNIAIINKGSVLLYDSLNSILNNMKSLVYQKNIELDQLSEYEEKYFVTSISQYKENTVIRIVGDNIPEGATLAEPTLEDVYFYYTGDIYD